MGTASNPAGAACPYKVGDVVYAPYGKGTVTAIKDGDCLVITPTDWKLANNCVPTFYIKATPPQYTPGVSYDPLPPTIGYSSGYTAVDSVKPPKPPPISSGATSNLESQPEAVIENMLDMTSAAQPEVWEEKAERL